MTPSTISLTSSVFTPPLSVSPPVKYIPIAVVFSSFRFLSNIENGITASTDHPLSIAPFARLELRCLLL